jgi:hypothetical protein
MGWYYEYNCINRLIKIANVTQAQWAKDHLDTYFSFDTSIGINIETSQQ